MYRKDRDINSQERKTEMLRNFLEWRKSFGVLSKNQIKCFKSEVKGYMRSTVVFDANVPVTKNIGDLMILSSQFKQRIASAIGFLRRENEEHTSHEVKNADVYFRERRHALVTEWSSNLYRLNNAINRRVGSLKDMEADLEETLRLTLAQHEIEAAVFEQTSCSRLENFWIQARVILFYFSNSFFNLY